MSWEADVGASPLSEPGIDELEEQTYRRLLAQPAATSREVAVGLDLSPRTAQRLLEAIEAKGLATHSPERPRRYIPAPPDIAVEALILRRQEQLQRARAAIQELQAEAKSGQRPADPDQMVELIINRESERQLFESMNRTAHHEVVTLVRPPVRVSQLDVPRDQDQRTQRQAQARGVRFRTVVDAEFLAVPSALNAVRADLKAGEDIRVVSHLPLKLVLADRSMAIIPLDLQRSDSPVLLVRSSSLLDALYALFETLWERATPLQLTSAGALPTGEPASQLPAGIEELVHLMAAGLNDKQIANELGISLRTLERRVADLMRALDARSRFQTGWQAALRFSRS